MPEEPCRSQVIEVNREPKRPAEDGARPRHASRLCESELVLRTYPSRINPLVAEDASLIELVEAVRSLEYGRPSDRTVSAMLREQRGTCSTKHLFLAEALFGREIATTVPDAGIVDVHRYLTATVGGRRITIDATFPGPAWDGHSPMPLSCGEGEDHLAGEHPNADKRSLEAEHCNPATREPFIASLARFSRAQR